LLRTDVLLAYARKELYIKINELVYI
jgi:hypothetical protein